MSNPPAVPYSAQPVPSRTSKSAITSLVCSFLVCIPFLMSGLAMLFGLVGFVKTGKPGVKGRWMAVVGGILGLLAFIGQFIFIGSIMAIILAAFGLTQAPRTAAHDFIRDISTLPLADFNTRHPQFAVNDQKQMADLQDLLHDQGTFEDTTFTSTDVNNNDAKVSGTAKFSKATLNVVVDLTKDGSDWKVTNFKFDK